MNSTYDSRAPKSSARPSPGWWGPTRPPSPQYAGQPSEISVPPAATQSRRREAVSEVRWMGKGRYSTRYPSASAGRTQSGCALCSKKPW